MKVYGIFINGIVIFFISMYIFMTVFGAALDQAFQYSIILGVASGFLKKIPF